MPKGSETKSYQAACVQFNVERGQVSTNLAAAEAGMRLAAESGADLIVLPEMWTTSLLADPTTAQVLDARKAQDALTRLTDELQVMVIGGGLEQDAGRCFNSCSITDCGKVLGKYRKIHTLSAIAEDRHITPGEAALIADTRLGRIGVAIGYDIRFPELIRYYFHMGVQVLAVPAQWPEAGAAHWRTLIRARAIENQMFVIGCNRTGAEESSRNDDTLIYPGDSRVVDPMGEVIASAQGDDEPILAEIRLRRCSSIQRILPIHRDRRPNVYRELWHPVWENPNEPKNPEVPTLEEAPSGVQARPPQD